jgi:hypothetical protein
MIVTVLGFIAQYNGAVGNGEGGRVAKVSLEPQKGNYCKDPY